jgi:putative protein-disulfide isomerase
MSGPHLIYFTDPMCSWCWGFSQVIEAIEARYGADLPIRLVLGGLRPGTVMPMTPEARRDVRGHWAKVTQASGQPFGASVVDDDGFVYDTDPAARAVVVARRADPAKALSCLRAIHRAFYVEGRDVTRIEVLADLAAEVGLNREACLEGLGSEAAKQETWGDYNISMNAGVTGFPTLIIGPRTDGQYSMITRGFKTADLVIAAIDDWLTTQSSAAA